MAQVKISGLTTGNALATDETPATDTLDTSQAATGTTKKYFRYDEFCFDMTAVGLNCIDAVKAGSTLPLTATYDNGVLGVGATLTNSGVQVAITLDGVTLAVGNRVLIKDQAAPAQNGIYTVTTLGSASVNWVLTRATDYDEAAEINQYDIVMVNQGSTQAGLVFQLLNAGPYTIGTTDLDFEDYLTNPRTIPLTATANQFLASTAYGSPVWSTATFPITVGAAGTVIRSNGTNWVASTSTFADTYAASSLLYSNGANTVTGLATANNGFLITNGSGVPSIGNTVGAGLTLSAGNFAVSAGTITASGNVSASGGGALISGASGTLGALTLYPTTALSGTLSVVPADSAGNYSNVLMNASTSAARTWTLPDATGTIALTSGASGHVTSGTQNQLAWYAATGDTVSGLATANNGFLLTNASGVPSIGNTSLGQLSIGNPASAQQYLTISGSNSGTNPASLANDSSSIILGNSSNTNNAYSSIRFTNKDGLIDSSIFGIHTDQAARLGSLAFYTYNGASLLLGMTIDNSQVVTTTKDAIINTVRVGLGGNSVATNTALGTTALGGNAGANGSNTAVGYRAMYQATAPGANNTVIGANTVASASFAGIANTLVGASVGNAMTSADNNTAVGSAALSLLTTGDFNSAFGSGVLAAITTSSDNIGIGYAALNAATASTSNIAIGKSSMGNAASPGADNTAIGNLTLSSASFTGARNTLMGNSAGLAMTSAVDNVGLGHTALTALTTGTHNISIGPFTLGTITTTSSNIAIGYGALSVATASSNNIAIGDDCLTNATNPGSFNTIVGNGSIVNAAFAGSRNTSLGYVANRSMINLCNDNTAIGYAVLTSNDSGINNTGVGSASLSFCAGDSNSSLGYGTGVAGATGAVSLTTGSRNTFVGYRACGNSATAAGTIALGADAVSTIATGATSSDAGPGIAIGSAAFPVGFRGDGTIYPSTTGAGFWRAKLNGTQYMVPLITDGASAWPAITTSSITFSSTSGVIGTTTNDNAAAGSVGEATSNVIGSGSAVSLTTATAANVTSLSLTAGDWDVWGNVSFIPAATTNVVQARGWISSTSATLPDASLYAGVQNAAAGIVPANNFGFCVPQQRVSLSGTTTIYLSVTAAFTVDTLGACGGLYARRRR